MALELYNSISRKIEVFEPLKKDKAVGVYTCGPTVYDYITIGNCRTYLLGDIAVRVLKYNDYDVKYVMNITDVGHLTGDNEGNADTGIDRLEKGAKREGKTAWTVAEFYDKDFRDGYKRLNLIEPEKFCKATDHIFEQIELVKKLEENGLVYKINDGMYFDTVAYEAKGYHYGELSNLDQIKAGARVEFNQEKRNARDFALWKFSPVNEKRDMEWDSHWGVGFPGWHIECSAMSMKYLGEQFDLHIGGEDLKSTHHPNEIAQSQGATGYSPFVKYWLHGAFLLVDGGKMGKSKGNAYTLHDLENKGISPLALRYFYFSGHYRSPLNFTWEALESSAHALQKIQDYYLEVGLPSKTGNIEETYKIKFLNTINDDLNIPQALAVLWELVKDEKITPENKKATLLDFDRVFGFGLADLKQEIIPDEINELVNQREQARVSKDFAKSDELRDKIKEMGYELNDTDGGAKVRKI